MRTRRTPQGVRGLKLPALDDLDMINMSHSARSAWIETPILRAIVTAGVVALRKECVD